jgi:small subunit ribosomal protein S9
MEKKTTTTEKPKKEEVKVEKVEEKKEETVEVNTEETDTPKVVTATIKKIDLAKGKYIRAIGRRKSSVATVHLFNEKGDITINEGPIDDYFDYKVYGGLILEPLKLVGASGKFKISIRVKGGGKRGQVGAIQLGIARVLVELDPDLRKALKANGFLKRDPRVKERKKPGLKRARKAPQWSKR